MRIYTIKKKKKKFTSIVASSCRSIGIGEPRVGVITPALSRALWSNTSNLKIRNSNLQLQMHLNDTLWLKFVHRNTHSHIINENHIQKQKFTKSYGNYDNAL